MKRRRLTSIFLSLMLIFSTVQPVYAMDTAAQASEISSEGENEIVETASAEEPAVPDAVAPAESPAPEETVPEAIEAQEVSSVPEITETAPAEESEAPETEAPAESSAVEETAPETPEAVPESAMGDPAPVEETTAPETEIAAESVETPEAAPAQDFSNQANGVTVTVNAPEGAFPAGTTMSVKEADAEAVQAAADAAEVDREDVKAVDISFAANGEEIEPELPVKVTLQSALAADADEVVVVHVDDDAQTEIVKDIAVNGESVTFEAKDFSVYAIVAKNAEKTDDERGIAAQSDDDKTNYNIVINYLFKDNRVAAQPYTASIAKGESFGATVNNPTVVGYQPTEPTGYDGSTVAVTFTGPSLTYSVENIAWDITLNVVYVPAEVNYTVKYYQQNVDNDNYKLADTVTKTGLTEGVVSETYNSEKDKYLGFYGLQFERPVIAADGSTVVEIYYDRNYYLMRFDLAGGYGVEPIYARYGAAISVGDPVRAGYTFGGWDEKIPKTMPAENSTYIAKWTAGNATYTVVYWYENADDDGYSYAGSITGSQNAGTTISSGDFQNTNFDGRDSTHFTYNSEKAESVTVAGDGSTVLNVYFRRNVYTLTFKSGTGNRASTYQVITAKYQASIGDQWPMAGQQYGNYTRVPSSLYYWSFTSVTTNSNVMQATKIFTMTADVCKTGGLTLTANTNNNVSSYTINYMMESLDGTGTLYDGIYYQNDSRYSQTLNYSRDQGTWGYKAIDGFTATDDSADVNNGVANLYYMRKRNTITFNDNYGVTVATVTDVMFEMPLSRVQHNGVAISELEPAYPGSLEVGAYEFGGWYTTAGCYDGTEADFENGIMPNANLAFYAKWVPVTHKITVYKDSSLSNKIGETITVSHGSVVAEDVRPETPENGSYTFVGWFYMENGVEKAFDFASMPVNKDLEVYAKWSSNVLVGYTINYTLEDGTVIAAQTTGQALAGSSKTFEAKVGEQLNADYQEGYFPTEASHTILMDIEGGKNNIYTFVYKPADNVPYTVKYLDAETGDAVALEKHVENNTKSVVTEYAVTVSGYLPNVFQQRLILTIDGENTLIFYYTKDDKHAIVSVTHNTINAGITTEYRHSEYTGDIGAKYTESALNITNYRLSSIVVNGEEVTADELADVEITRTLTAEGLNIVFNYTAQYYVVYQSEPENVITKDVSASESVTAVHSGRLYGGLYKDSNYTTPYTDICGAGFQPQVGVTYYVKEVADTYLVPKQIDTYNYVLNYLRDIILVTTVDDGSYKEAGFLIGVSDYRTGDVVENVTVTFGKNPEDGVEEKSYGVSDVSANSAGYIANYKYFSVTAGENGLSYDSISGKTILVKAYWVTPDGVTVTGKITRMITVKDKDGDGVINYSTEITVRDLTTGTKATKR